MRPRPSDHLWMESFGVAKKKGLQLLRTLWSDAWDSFAMSAVAAELGPSTKKVNWLKYF